MARFLILNFICGLWMQANISLGLFRLSSLPFRLLCVWAHRTWFVLVKNFFPWHTSNAHIWYAKAINPFTRMRCGWPKYLPIQPFGSRKAESAICTWGNDWRHRIIEGIAFKWMKEQRLELNTTNIFDHHRKGDCECHWQRLLHVCRICRYNFYSSSFFIVSGIAPDIDDTFLYPGLDTLARSNIIEKINRKSGTEFARIHSDVEGNEQTSIGYGFLISVICWGKCSYLQKLITFRVQVHIANAIGVKPQNQNCGRVRCSRIMMF